MVECVRGAIVCRNSDVTNARFTNCVMSGCHGSVNRSYIILRTFIFQNYNKKKDWIENPWSWSFLFEREFFPLYVTVNLWTRIDLYGDNISVLFYTSTFLYCYWMLLWNERILYHTFYFTQRLFANFIFFKKITIHLWS